MKEIFRSFPSLKLVKSSSVKRPIASVLVRVRNEFEQLPRFIDSLNQQLSDPPFEVIYLDSGSTDGSLDLLKSTDCSIYAISPSEFSFGKTCNLLMQLSNSEVCFFFSAHVILNNKSIIAAGTNAILTEGLSAAYYRQIPNYHIGASVYETAFLRRNFPPRNLIHTADSKELKRFSNAASVISKKAWRFTPFPDVSANEDALWAQELMSQRHGKVAYFGELAVSHSHNETPEQVYRRVLINAYARNSGLIGLFRALVRFTPMYISLLAAGGTVRSSWSYSYAHFSAYVTAFLKNKGSS